MLRAKEEVRSDKSRHLLQFDEEKRRKREEEEAASRELIEKLQQLEEQERLEKERLALSDEALARDLEKAMKEVTLMEGHFHGTTLVVKFSLLKFTCSKFSLLFA